MDDLTKYPQKHSGSRPAADEPEEERESDRRHDLRRRYFVQSIFPWKKSCFLCVF